MKDTNIKNMISYRAEHPADDSLTVFNRWQAMQPRILNNTEIKEAMLLSELHPDKRLIAAPQEGGIFYGNVR